MSATPALFVVQPDNIDKTPSAIRCNRAVMFPSTSGVVIYGGTFNSSTNRISRGMDILLNWVATGAFHNSDELYDVPNCDRSDVLDDIMKWVGESESARDDFMMWLFGPADAGKSAIAKRIAEITADKGVLIATFFFSRTSPTRNNKDRLIATLAYQLALSIPDTRSYIESAIEHDPTIFRKNVKTQIDTLLIKPFQSISSTQVASSKKLIIIDGLDECNDSHAQLVILEAISRSFPQHNLPIKFLIVSRPEISLATLFSSQEPLKSIHRPLALIDTYQPDDDIRLSSDKSKQIPVTYSRKKGKIRRSEKNSPSRPTTPNSLPTQELLDNPSSPGYIQSGYLQSNPLPPKLTSLPPVRHPSPDFRDFQYSTCTGRRRALCIGINYPGQKNELRGCINDAKNIRKFLQRYHYKPEDVVLLTDDVTHPRMLPTRQNILEAMRWLTRGAKPNDALFFYYSGHGGQTRDLDGDKASGWNEVIYPLDLEKNGHIADDLMHDIMPLPSGCRLTGLFDARHSELALDLPFVYSSRGGLKSSSLTPYRAVHRRASPADVTSWSASTEDGQISEDTLNGVAVGVMTCAFITALTTKPEQTYKELLQSIRLILKERNGQKPRLGSSHMIDTNLRFIF